MNSKAEQDHHADKPRGIEEFPTSMIRDNEPRPASEQQERTRNNEAVVEHGNEGDCLGEKLHITDLTRAHVGHEHTDEAC